MASLGRKLGFFRMKPAEAREYWGAKMKDGQMMFILRIGTLFAVGGAIGGTVAATVHDGLTVMQAVEYFVFLTLLGIPVQGFLGWYLVRWRYRIG